MLTCSIGNAQYTSPRKQNEIIEVCNNLIVQNLMKELNAFSCFSILIGETSEISGLEQLSLCVHYVDRENLSVKETFLQFIPLYDVTGKGIATVILDKLHSLNVNIYKICGQEYDGAMSMSGKVNGVQAHVKEIILSALYVHCSTHSLILAVSSAWEETAIRNCMGTISSLYKFLNIPKRQHVLKSEISEMETTTSCCEKYIQLCATH
ncbi:zinc finger MYM-type protein 1-like [Lycorma delicatula]|uniref:zinc finger MYM-type protein 1-like n=1 Tax=Lycorma delicatula TaxID=130591 RepID=UPI003F511474